MLLKRFFTLDFKKGKSIEFELPKNLEKTLIKKYQNKSIYI
jgi:hypothetical protein